MVWSGEGDQELERRYQELCADLNMDKNASEEGWQSFQRIGTNYTLEGDSLHWLGCALYVACRKGMVPTVGSGRCYIEGNLVSLTRLLRTCKLSLVQFFSKMKKWADMANLPQDLRSKIDRLERNFNVSTVIFKKYKPIFRDLFRNPDSDPPRPQRSRKQRKQPCTSSDVFNFCWTLYVYVKGNFPAISDDLVNSYHLLLCCLDLFYANALLADRRDLLNAAFEGMPKDFHSKEYKPPTTPPCIIEILCNAHQGLVVEAKGIKEHWWKPRIKKLMDERILRGKADTLSGLLDIVHFEYNRKSVDASYEEYVLKIGDFDERIFLGENANEEIGTPARNPHSFAAVLEEKIARKQMQKHLAETRSLAPSTPLTSRRFLIDKEAINVTPVSTATQSVCKLQALLQGQKSSPSEALMELFSECSRNPHDTIVELITEMGKIFCTKYAQPSEDEPGSRIDFSKQRLQLGETLYYKVLINILKDEKKRFPPKTDLSKLFEHAIFHKSLFACCLEIVIFSYNSQRTFPWILEVFDLFPVHFYKVIELLIRAEDGLSRDVVKHLKHIEEQILESLAWKSESPLWDEIKASGLGIPSCEEVFPPEQMDNQISHHLMASSERRDVPGTPTTPSLSEQYQAQNSEMTSSVRRKLFGSNANEVTGTEAESVESSATLPVPAQMQLPLTPPNMKEAEVAPLTAAVATTSSCEPSGANCNSSSPEVKPSTKPFRTGSLALFFRKVYYLASVRLRDLCDRLDMSDGELRKKIWTCFEHSLREHADLMCDRHLDQLIMCAVYVICKVTKQDRNFQEVMKCYRQQPQASSHVYRSVLLSSKKRRNSGNSDNSKNGSGSSSPVPPEKDEHERESRRTERLSTIRSSSTLPVPLPSSQPPTPTRLAGTSTQFEYEDRGDVIMFYNSVYVPKLQKFVMKFSPAMNGGESPPLSPLPRPNSSRQSPWRRVSAKHTLYISPMKNTSYPGSPIRAMTYSFCRSPGKDLQAINNMMNRRKVGKRNLQDDLEGENPSKAVRTDLSMRMIQDVINERQEPGPKLSE